MAQIVFLQLMPTEVLAYMLTFVKTDSYAIVGAVCKEFKRNYAGAEKVTRISKYTQSAGLLYQATAHLNIRFNGASLLDHLISHDNIESIPTVLSRGLEWDHFCVERAAEMGRYRFFRWLATTELPWLPENAHAAAASSDDLAMMMFLVQSGAGYPDDRSLLIAEKNKSRGIIAWLRETSLDPVFALVRAARDDTVRAFEHSAAIVEGDSAVQQQKYVTEACASGSLNVLEFFRRSLGVAPTRADVRAAKHFNQFEVLDWVLEFFPELLELD